MTDMPALDFAATDTAAIAGLEGRVAVLLPPEGRWDAGLRRVDRLTRGALKRLSESKAFGKLKDGEATTLAFPGGMACEALVVVRLPRRSDAESARKAGGALGRAAAEGRLTVLAGATARLAEIAEALMLRAYGFRDHKTGEDAGKRPGPVSVMCSRPEAAREAFAPFAARAEGVYLARDLINAPANVLTTESFARRLEDLRAHGLSVEVFDEDELTRMGLRAMLAVGQGSESPSKLVVMEWKGAEAAHPLALVGKGVVFDTGGISIKPAAGMEEMTMDMGGAGVVAGTMLALARRKARAHVVGIVGLVENMPDGRAQRPGDVVRTLKGDTVEVINTDAEGRLVLADVMWYAQERFHPAAIVDLATLTGAIIIGLGHDKAGVFASEDRFCADFLKAAEAEGEGAWRMPLDPTYDRLLKSRIADLKNVGGRAAGSVTAARFLARFVQEGLPWIHLDIAGVALPPEETLLAQKGATGWGVRALDRLVRDRFEA